MPVNLIKPSILNKENATTYFLFKVFKDMQLFHKAVSAIHIDLCLYFSLISDYILCLSNQFDPQENSYS